MQIRFDLSEKLYNSINKNCEEGKRAEFIRQAIEEKLSRKQKEDKVFNNLIDKIGKLDPLEVHIDLKNLLLTTQIIFEEVKKLQVSKVNSPTPKISKQTDTPKQNPQPNKESLGTCPKCSLPLKRDEKSGYILCSNFPKCQHHVRT